MPLSPVMGRSLAMVLIGRQVHFALSLCIYQKWFKNQPKFLPNRSEMQFRLRIARYFYRFPIFPLQLACRDMKHFHESAHATCDAQLTIRQRFIETRFPFSRESSLKKDLSTKPLYSTTTHTEYEKQPGL